MEEKVEEKKPEGEEIDENVAMAVIAYFLFFVPLLTDSKDDPFVKFHVKQSLLIFSLNIGLYILRFFPVIGRFMWAITPITSLAIFALFIIGIINAINKQKKELPFIGKFADQIFKF
jgi:uncharacterized membrane protein